MRVLIVGAGVVGTNLAAQLSSEGHDVAVVDRDPAVIERLTEKADVMALAGDGSALSVLKAAGLEGAEMVVGVTESDAVNMLVCATAGRFGVGQKIARVRNREFVDDAEDFYRETFAIDQLINPEEFIADSLSQMIRIPGCVDVARFDAGDVLLGGFAVDPGAALAECPIEEIRRRHGGARFLIVAVSRAGRLFIPRGRDQIAAGDKVYVVVPRPDLERFVPLVTRGEFRDMHRVVMAGGSPESLRLARALEDHGHKVALIERDPARARAAAECLAGSIVYQGRATDLDLLREAGADQADFFVAAGPEDESNLYAALLAKREGARRAVVFTREAEHLPLLYSIGLDVVINPRLATAGAILHLVRRGKILQAAKLGHSDAEAIQFEVPARAAVAGRPLRELTLPAEAIVGAVQRDGEVSIPGGDTTLAPGDRVVVFTLPAAVPGVERLFAGG